MTPHQERLLEKAGHSIEAARTLLGSSHPGFAAARAYYAMFYVVQALLLAYGLTFSSHAATISAFGKHFAKSGRVPAELHRFLIKAESIRITGDYDVDEDIAPEEAQVHIDRATHFIEFGRSFLSGE